MGRNRTITFHLRLHQASPRRESAELATDLPRYGTSLTTAQKNSSDLSLYFDFYSKIIVIEHFLHSAITTQSPLLFQWHMRKTKILLHAIFTCVFTLTQAYDHAAYAEYCQDFKLFAIYKITGIGKIAGYFINCR